MDKILIPYPDGTFEEKRYHKIKIDINYALPVIQGIKNFEVRKNDRDYQVGDIIQFDVVKNDFPEHHYYRDGQLVQQIPGVLVHVNHPLNDKTFIITYVLKNFCEGLIDGYCVFGIKQFKIIDDSNQYRYAYSIKEDE